MRRIEKEMLEDGRSTFGLLDDSCLWCFSGQKSRNSRESDEPDQRMQLDRSFRLCAQNWPLPRLTGLRCDGLNMIE